MTETELSAKRFEAVRAVSVSDRLNNVFEGRMEAYALLNLMEDTPEGRIQAFNMVADIAIQVLEEFPDDSAQ